MFLSEFELIFVFEDPNISMGVLEMRLMRLNLIRHQCIPHGDDKCSPQWTDIVHQPTVEGKMRHACVRGLQVDVLFPSVTENLRFLFAFWMFKQDTKMLFYFRTSRYLLYTQ